MDFLKSIAELRLDPLNLAGNGTSGSLCMYTTEGLDEFFIVEEVI